MLFVVAKTPSVYWFPFFRSLPFQGRIPVSRILPQQRRLKCLVPMPSRRCHGQCIKRKLHGVFPGNGLRLGSTVGKGIKVIIFFWNDRFTRFGTATCSLIWSVFFGILRETSNKIQGFWGVEFNWWREGPGDKKYAEISYSIYGYFRFPSFQGYPLRLSRIFHSPSVIGIFCLHTPLQR